MDTLSTLFLPAASAYTFSAVLINLVMAIAVMALARVLLGTLLRVGKTSVALAETDNHAFGISLAAMVLGMSLILAGATSGEAAVNINVEVLSVAAYALAGLIFMFGGRAFNDRILFPHLAVGKSVAKGNVPVALLDAGNIIATAIIIKTAMQWPPMSAFGGLAMLIIFLFSQALLGAVAAARMARFRKYAVSVGQSDVPATIGEAVEQGNGPLALRFSGFLIGAALAMSSANGMVAYADDHFGLSLILWGGTAAGFTVGLMVLTMVLEKIILSGIPVSREVNIEKNWGVAAVEAAAYAGIGLVMTTLL